MWYEVIPALKHLDIKIYLKTDDISSSNVEKKKHTNDRQTIFYCHC
jgi:hypothetical protein